MGQRDPLVEYQREGFDLFVAMMDSVKEESVTYAFAAQVQVTPTTERVQVDAPGLAKARSTEITDSDLEYPDTPRNSSCPCGSGKKYKRCHGDSRR
jgi:preprotein translocase subunit SecA